MFNLGGIHIRNIQKQDSIEIFEVMTRNEGLGPGHHIHHKMEETFYIIEGSVLFTTNQHKQILEKGESFSVLRGTPHSWKTAKENTKMLLIFTPAQNQLGYFAELEKLYQQGSSWEEAIPILAHNFDNTPINEVS
jgi:quercetin dioxygenase-like cupin family protein